MRSGRVNTPPAELLRQLSWRCVLLTELPRQLSWLSSNHPYTNQCKVEQVSDKQVNSNSVHGRSPGQLKTTNDTNSKQSDTHVHDKLRDTQKHNSSTTTQHIFSFELSVVKCVCTAEEGFRDEPYCVSSCFLLCFSSKKDAVEHILFFNDLT